jgi:diguanylate cyclase (GGDEF)-like protein
MQDITERKTAEARLSHQALHDPLTGLPNRTLFADRMLIARARLRRGGSLAVLFLDLDDFKAVNDRLGHESGDHVLTEISGRLSSVLRPSDTIARLGGDEFAVLCDGVDERGATAIAERLAGALRRPLRISGGELSMTASTGIVVTGDPDRDGDSLLREADAAMYVAKRSGGARYIVFDEDIAASVSLDPSRR